jgi:threonine/homoserine/homoserine lactone efflux protein
MIVDALLIFLLISALSFVGSLQPGPVNMTVLRITSDHGRRDGFLAALGGCLPEIPYSIAAIFLSDLLLKLTFLEEILGYFVGAVLIFLGVITIMKRSNEIRPGHEYRNPFMNGFIMGILNPQLITYWLVIYLWLQTSDLFETGHLISKTAFVLGTFSGALMLMWLVMQLTSNQNAQRFLNNRVRRDLIIGSVFVVLGCWILLRSFIE